MFSRRILAMLRNALHEKNVPSCRTHACQPAEIG